MKIKAVNFLLKNSTLIQQDIYFYFLRRRHVSKENKQNLQECLIVHMRILDLVIKFETDSSLCNVKAAARVPSLTAVSTSLP